MGQPVIEVMQNELKCLQVEESVRAPCGDPNNSHGPPLQSRATAQLREERNQEAEMANNEINATYSEKLWDSQDVEERGVEIQASWMERCFERGIPSGKKAARILMDANPTW